MVSRLLFLLMVFFISANTNAQTKLLAFKSFGGVGENLGPVLHNTTILNIGNSNFGMAPERTVTNARLDSIILLSDSVAVMVTSTFCENRVRNTSKLWKVGKDTVYHHPLFSGQQSIDSIRSILGSEYFFCNEPDSVKFIGFNEEQPVAFLKKNKTILALPVSKPQEPGSKSNLLIALIGVILAVSVYVGLLADRYYRMRPHNTSI